MAQVKEIDWTTLLAEPGFIERFWERVIKTETCWLWKGAGKEYGKVRWKGKQYRAHRVSWAIHHGPIPFGLFALHKCDVKPCIHPDHLFLGKDKENMEDCAKKGRIDSRGSGLRDSCIKGHPYTTGNFIVDKKHGWRRCLVCQRASQKMRYHAAMRLP